MKMAAAWTFSSWIMLLVMPSRRTTSIYLEWRIVSVSFADYENGIAKCILIRTENNNNNNNKDL